MGETLYCSAADAGVWGERLWWWLHPLHLTQQNHLASMAAWLSSTGISHYSLLPHIPSICLSTVNSSLHPGIAPQSLKSSSQRWAVQGTCVAIRGLYGYGKDCLILITFRLPQISGFILSLKCFSSDSDNCSDMGIRPLLQFPHPPRAGPVLLTLLFFPLVPSSDRVLCGSIYFFPTAQILLSSLSRCSACSSVSEDVFLMYLWREMYSTSTYSSALFLQTSSFKDSWS